ncbi:MAG: DUF1822 family protein, partial [Cyanothece sp. SIO2G6]|nr:DUF1822 family protein [Cyanothece sp. SIO2G6]
VLSVHHYCQLLGIPSDVTHCDCWNPFWRLTSNVADVDIIGVGRFECCVISAADAGQPSACCMIPAEVEAERVGYIVVQIEEEVADSGPEIYLLGFADGAMPLQKEHGLTESELPLSALRSLFELPEYLHQLAHAKPSLTHLSQWFQHTVEAGWITVERLLGPQPQLQVRTMTTQTRDSSCRYGKILTLDTTTGPKRVTLITEIIDRPNRDLAVELTICPIPNTSESATSESATSESATSEFLPPGLEMTVVDAMGDGVMQAQTRRENRMIELGFHVEQGDRFQLHIELEGTVITESFLV